LQSELGARLSAAALGRWEIEALNYDLGERLLYARLGGPAEANAALADELRAAWPRSFILEEARSETWWRHETEFCWAEGLDILMKVPMTLADLPAIFAVPKECRTRIASGGSYAWIARPAPAFEAVQSALAHAGLMGLLIRGKDAPLFTSPQAWSDTQRAVQRVFDPDERFAKLEP
jgi:hypothetical protein